MHPRQMNARELGTIKRRVACFPIAASHFRRALHATDQRALLSALVATEQALLNHGGTIAADLALIVGEIVDQVR